MANFQADTFVFGPLEWCWLGGALLGLAWPVADLCPYFGAHVDGSLVLNLTQTLFFMHIKNNRATCLLLI